MAWGLLLGLGSGCHEGNALAGDARDAEANEALSDSGADAGLVDGGARSWLDDTLRPLPQRLSELGLHHEFEDDERHPDDARFIAYEPAWPLWSNGGTKRRYVVLPGAVDSQERSAWQFSPGTVFFKTFFFGEDEHKRPVETRVLRLAERWEYAAYQWTEDSRDAILLDGKAGVPVEVVEGGARFTHQIPSRLECRACHESSPSAVLGFSELQLNHGPTGESSWLERIGAHLTHGVPTEPDVIPDKDPQLQAVLGYLTGNCVHCHNGSGVGPNSVYDLRHEVAMSNLIDRPSETSGSVSGIRVIAGQPEQSVLLQSFLRDAYGAKPMPPVGVQLRDERGLVLLREWILSLPRPP